MLRKLINAADVYRIALREYRGAMPEGIAGERIRAKLRKWAKSYVIRFYGDAEKQITTAVRNSAMYKATIEREKR